MIVSQSYPSYPSRRRSTPHFCAQAIVWVCVITLLPNVIGRGLSISPTKQCVNFSLEKLSTIFYCCDCGKHVKTKPRIWLEYCVYYPHETAIGLRPTLLSKCVMMATGRNADSPTANSSCVTVVVSRQ